MVQLNNVAIFIVFDLFNKNGNKTKINCGKKKKLLVKNPVKVFNIVQMIQFTIWLVT